MERTEDMLISIPKLVDNNLYDLSKLSKMIMDNIFPSEEIFTTNQKTEFLDELKDLNEKFRKSYIRLISIYESEIFEVLYMQNISEKNKDAFLENEIEALTTELKKQTTYIAEKICDTRISLIKQVFKDYVDHIVLFNPAFLKLLLVFVDEKNNAV
jgi:hypothetical protein